MSGRTGGRGRASWVLVAALAATGCGEPGGSGVAVSGRVTFDGKPVEEGTVTLAPVGDPEAAVVSASIKDGAFRTTRADGPRPGKHRVEIRAFAPPDGSVSAKARARAAAGVNTVMFGKDPSAFSGPAGLAAPRVNFVPERYNARSELTAEIPAAPAHEVAFDLSK